MEVTRTRCELWSTLADYVIAEADGTVPRDAVEIGRLRCADGLRSVLSAALGGSPGNAAMLRWFVGPHACGTDEMIDEITQRVVTGQLRLWEVERRIRWDWPSEDIPRLSDLIPRDGDVPAALTWIEVGVVDQFGRPLPWMLARLRLPSGSMRERRLDVAAHTREDGIAAPGLCRLELRAPAPEAAVAMTPSASPTTGGAVGLGEPVWLGLRVVDQFGRALPWMRARLADPPLEIAEIGLDDDARGRLQFMAAAQRCTVEVRAPATPGTAQ